MPFGLQIHRGMHGSDQAVLRDVVAHHYHVDLDRREAAGAGSLQTGQHFVQHQAALEAGMTNRAFISDSSKKPITGRPRDRPETSKPKGDQARYWRDLKLTVDLYSPLVTLRILAQVCL